MFMSNTDSKENIIFIFACMIKTGYEGEPGTGEFGPAGPGGTGGG